jgi:hypothetical protein
MLAEIPLLLYGCSLTLSLESGLQEMLVSGIQQSVKPLQMIYGSSL